MAIQDVQRNAYKVRRLAHSATIHYPGENSRSALDGAPTLAEDGTGCS